ncbi:MAG: HlyD family efflux transporter periplasmic adaptor subunit [Gammaproteobacteria bacterium]|nr:HlyD family efflux transporter periplasmic adaptor subunit [Gammaproteobacteria bacterium]
MVHINNDMVQSWLELQCSMVTGVTGALVLLSTSESDDYGPIACWPADSGATPTLSQAAQRAIQEHRRIVDTPPAPPLGIGHPASDFVACPVFVDGQLLGAFAVRMTGRAGPQQRAALQVFSWGAALLEILLRSQAAAAEGRLQTLVEVIAQAVNQKTCRESATAVANVLASQLDCTRVTIGFIKGQDFEIAAMSNTARIEEKNNLVRAIVQAMHESVDQDASIMVPLMPEHNAPVTDAHDRVAELGGGVVCTVPLTHHDQCVGALTLERAAGRDFDMETLELCESVASIVGPVLDSKRQEQRSLLARLGASLRGQLSRLFGPGHLLLKTAMAVSAGVLLLLSLVQGDHRIDARSRLEGTTQRVVVAPYDGFLAEAPVRAGDIVEQGQLLCRLDDRDLKLERAKWSGERAQHLKARREALGNHERTEISLTKSRLEQAEAELAMVEEKLARTRVTAPLSGIVVSGDLSQSLGIPLERGQVLFEVAPLDSYRIMLEVDERDIGYVKAGQQGRLALSGSPHETHLFTVERILPVSTAADGKNFFQVEASLKEDSETLRPGMLGIGKIDAGEHRLIWLWTHKLTDWLRLSLWSWWG